MSFPVNNPSQQPHASTLSNKLLKKEMLTFGYVGVGGGARAGNERRNGVMF